MIRSIVYTLIVILIVVAGFFVWQKMEPEKVSKDESKTETSSESIQGGEQESTVFNQGYESGMTYRESGDYVSAADAFETAIESAPSEAEKAEAQRRAGVANFLTNDSQKQVEGIGQLKESIATAPDPFRKAVAIADLASTVCGNGCDADIFAEVFKDEPYSAYRAGDDVMQSVKNLYEWSIDVAPNPDALVRAATWYADQLLAGDSNPTYVTKLDGLMVQIPDVVYKVRQGARSEISFYFWSGYAYGALATTDLEEYGPSFEEAYRKSITLGKFEPAGSNKNYAVLFAYYQYAALLDRLYGEARAADVKANLDALMTSVNNDPNPANNQFLAMARNELTVAGSQHAFVGSALSTLAHKYPEFKAFLESYDLQPE
jgi:tetratricopeptide (TPR) repeat protein